MARSKTTKTAETTEQVSTPVVNTAAPASEPVVVEKTPKAKKAAKAPVASSTEENVVVVAADQAAPVEEVVDGDAPLAEQSVEFHAKLQQIGVLISSLKSEYRALEKKWTRDLKTAQKQSIKRKRKAGNRAPSGFVKPTRISDELAKFLEKPVGSEMARTEVTRDINTYIRSHQLQDKENGRKINPDSKLAALLKLKKTDELTYFNLQRYMSPHFAKSVKEVVSA
jgi:upstream activation factor subunit UAF30